MKAINQAWRAAGKPGPEDKEGWAKIAEHPEVRRLVTDLEAADDVDELMLQKKLVDARPSAS